MATKATIDALQKIAGELKDAGWGNPESHYRFDRATAFRSTESTMKERAFSLLTVITICGLTLAVLLKNPSQPVTHWIMFGVASVAAVIHAVLLGSAVTDYWWNRNADPR
ncbi:MAG: hypothetical protein WEB58_07095 [Planctomycetaceae bacterium]